MHNRSLTAAASARGRAAGGRPRRRGVAVLVGALLALGLLAAPAAAHTDQPHSHSLLLHAEVEWTAEGPTVSYERCVDLANARKLPNHVHHDSVHTGVAGAALQGAGHVVVPYTCAQVASIFN